MTTKQLLIVIVIISIILLINPVNAKMVNGKVDDKGLIYVQYDGLLGTLHTEYGTIIVSDEDYNSINVNDTIRYDTNKNTFWGYYWEVKKVE